MSMHRCFTLILCLIFSFKLSYSSHFLGGTITWRPLNASATGSPVAIIIIQTTSWNYSSIKCTDANIKNGASIPNVSSLKNVTLACINNCGNGSIGYLNNITVIPACTGFSAPVGTTVGQRSDLVYLAANDDFSVAFAAGAWCSLTTVIGGNWSLAARINLVPRLDNGLYNNPPVATVMSPINIPYNKTLVMHIPVGDADGQQMPTESMNVLVFVRRIRCHQVQLSFLIVQSLFPAIMLLLKIGLLLQLWLVGLFIH